MNKKRFTEAIYIESYGVKICVRATHPDAIEAIRKILPSFLADQYHETSEIEADHKFYYSWNKIKRDTLYREKEAFGGLRLDRAELIDVVGEYIRMAVVEFAVDQVFVHAGVVAVNGEAIVIPGKSFSGKTTLVAEFVRRGAVYYSDEYAIFDRDGQVSPFARKLSIREKNGEKKQTGHSVESLGGLAGTEKMKVSMILVSQYKKRGSWKPTTLTPAQALMELIKNTLPIRNKPEESLAVLSQVVENALILKSDRGDASECVSEILRQVGSKECVFLTNKMPSIA